MPGRIYVTFALEDHTSRDTLATQARTAGLLVEFESMSSKQPWLARWKADARARIRKSDGMIVLIGKKMQDMPGLKWEVECAREADLPILAVHLDKHSRPPIPAELSDVPAIDWDWKQIAGFIQAARGTAGMSA